MLRCAAAVIGVLAASVLFAEQGKAAGADGAAEPVQVGLQFVRASPVSDAALLALTRETAAIWAPEGVAVFAVLSADELSADEGGEREGALYLKVILRDQPANRVDGRTPSGYRALASVPFVAPSTPVGVIFASLGAARQTARGAQPGRLPELVQERLALRLLGRAIAHELGHYLLRSTAHSGRGLMRASFGQHDLVTPSLAGFHLEAHEAAALAERTAGPHRPDDRPPVRPRTARADGWSP